MPKIHVPDHVAQAIEEETKTKNEAKKKEKETPPAEEAIPYVEQVQEF